TGPEYQTIQTIERVQLLGFWPSPYSYRVIWALKLKGVNYEYIEEDFPSKSELLLRYNPVHKKIPVLIHRGKPIVESRVILEYIEETWPENPLLPKDAYERAVARFWIQFGEDKGLTFYGFFRSTTREAQEKSGKEVIEVLKILEEQCLGDKMFFGGSSLGLVDISFGWLAYWFGVMEEVVGAKLFEPNAFPRLHAWAQNFKEISLIKENLPDRERLSAHFKRIRESFFIDLSSHNE
ncbi:probable glutathione S-transferase, partial [Rhododendron vialii]|uniref:probable glutathione S-transferase n=1 Tax=Rhododendron vialii TaxID=182163 RepID=UPI00265F5EF5